MLTVILVAIVGAVATLAVSWIVSFVGFRALVRAGSPARATAWTSTVGQLTGLVLVLGAVATVTALIVQAVR